MRTYWNTENHLQAINEWQPNCWIQVTCPTDEDQRLLEDEFKIPDYFLSDISDTDERARYADRRYAVVFGNEVNHPQAGCHHHRLLLRNQYDD